MTHEQEAARLGIRPPAPVTLARYGLTRADWLAIVARQGWRCPVCETRPNTFNIDHEHVPRWKYLPSEERKRYVRGVLCWYCNHRLVRSRIEASTVENIARYLRAYEARRDARG